MAEFKVNTDRLKTDAEKVKGYVDRIQAKMTRLIKYLAELDAMWDGAASDSFQKAYKDDLLALSIMISNMAKLYGYENEAKVRYEICERQISTMISEI